MVQNNQASTYKIEICEALEEIKSLEEATVNPHRSAVNMDDDSL